MGDSSLSVHFFTSVEVNFKFYILATSNIFSLKKNISDMEKTRWRELFTHSVYLFLFFNVSVSYIIFTSCPSHFQKIEFYLNMIWVISNIFE